MSVSQTNRQRSCYSCETTSPGSREREETSQSKFWLLSTLELNSIILLYLRWGEVWYNFCISIYCSVVVTGSSPQPISSIFLLFSDRCLAKAFSPAALWDQGQADRVAGDAQIFQSLDARQSQLLDLQEVEPTLLTGITENLKSVLATLQSSPSSTPSFVSPPRLTSARGSPPGSYKSRCCWATSTTWWLSASSSAESLKIARDRRYRERGRRRSR